jgi:hypothetical protein
MKELLSGFWAMIWAIIVTILIWPISILYSFGYSIWLTITMKKWYAFFQFWWRLVDGFAAALGNLFFEIAYSLDLTWNVNGEIIEDMITSEEDTTFAKKNISVSASTGKLELDGKLNKIGFKFSKTLNFFFGQERHAIDSWKFLEAKNKLRDQYFKKKY